MRDVVAISVGHPQAYGRAGFEQKFGKGSYTLGFQLRGLAEAWFLRNRARGLRNWLASRHPDPEAVVSAMSRPGRLTAGMNWYRANLVDVLFGAWPRCTVPVLGMWSSGDRYLTEAQMTNSARLVDAAWEYRRRKLCTLDLHWNARVPCWMPRVHGSRGIRWPSERLRLAVRRGLHGKILTRSGFGVAIPLPRYPGVEIQVATRCFTPLRPTCCGILVRTIQGCPE